MNISKISRSIIVVIFVVLVLFLSVIDIMYIFNKERDVAINATSSLVKCSFILFTILFTCVYMYIKDKLYKKHVKRKLSFIYRYIYIVFILLMAAIFSLRNVLSVFSESKMFLHILFLILTAFIIKRIVFNVSKSDMLSVLTMFAYAFFPNVVLEEKFYVSSLIFNASFLSYILVFQIIIDELKQKGIKTKKYILLSLVLGMLMVIASAIGANICMFALVFLVSMVITYNLDNTHINFSSKFMSSLTQQKREELYKIERININKLLVVIMISMLVLLAGNLVLKCVIKDVEISNSLGIINFFEEDVENVNKFQNINQIIEQFLTVSKKFVCSAPMFYIVIFAYIVFMEILAFCLHRRYDTKSTVMKLIFVVMFVGISIFGLNICYFEPLLITLLMLIAVVNTSNIYLNREERIKLLVA